MVLEVALMNPVFSASILFHLSIFGCLCMVEQIESLENFSYVTQAILYRTVTLSAAFLIKNVGRLQPNGSGLGSDKKNG